MLVEEKPPALQASFHSGDGVLRTVLKSKIGIASGDISLTEAKSEESERFTKMITVSYRSNQQNKNSKHATQFGQTLLPPSNN